MRVRWRPGEIIVHREVWRGRPWCACPVVVVDESPELLVTYLPELVAMLDRGERWWDRRWSSFEPDPAWRAPTFPAGWRASPVLAAPSPAAYGRLR